MEYGGSEKCVIFMVRFGYKCRVKCGKKTELRKKYEEYDINHAFDEYSTDINICWKKFVKEKKNGERREWLLEDEQSLKFWGVITLQK